MKRKVSPEILEELKATIQALRDFPNLPALETWQDAFMEMGGEELAEKIWDQVNEEVDEDYIQNGVPLEHEDSRVAQAMGKDTPEDTPSLDGIPAP